MQFWADTSNTAAYEDIRFFFKALMFYTLLNVSIVFPLKIEQV